MRDARWETRRSRYGPSGYRAVVARCPSCGGFAHGACARDLEVRFWLKVDKTGECWIWQGKRNGAGYGMVKVATHERRAHRVAWELTYGPIPDGLLALHHCDNPPRVRPDHLFLGTDADNVRDAVSKGRVGVRLRGRTLPLEHRRHVSEGLRRTLDERGPWTRHPPETLALIRAKLRKPWSAEARRAHEEANRLRKESHVRTS